MWKSCDKRIKVTSRKARVNIRGSANLLEQVHFDVLGGWAEIVEVALGVLLQVGRDGQPEGALMPVQKVVQNDAGDRAALPDAGPVADKEARALAAPQSDAVPLARVHHRLELQRRQVALGDDVLRQTRPVHNVRRLDARQRVGLHHRIRMRLPVFHCKSDKVILQIIEFK